MLDPILKRSRTLSSADELRRGTYGLGDSGAFGGLKRPSETCMSVAAGRTQELAIGDNSSSSAWGMCRYSTDE
jgi:hypothetical protein